MFEIFVITLIIGGFCAVLLAMQLSYAALLKLLNPKASWKKCLKKAGW